MVYNRQFIIFTNLIKFINKINKLNINFKADLWNFGNITLLMMTYHDEKRIKIIHF